MNCEDFDNRLEDWLDGELADFEQARMSRHAESCAACRAEREVARLVREGLGQLPEVAPPPGFAPRVIATAVARAERQRARPGMRVAAVAAVLALCAIVVGLLPEPASDPAVQATVTLDGGVKMVRLAIDSAAAVDNARLTITLSDNLGIEGYGNRRTLTWNTPLKAGVNMLSLPVYAIALGDGEIAANLSIGEQQKAFVVKTRNPGADARHHETRLSA